MVSPERFLEFQQYFEYGLYDNLKFGVAFCKEFDIVDKEVSEAKRSYDAYSLIVDRHVNYGESYGEAYELPGDPVKAGKWSGQPSEGD